MLCVAVPVSWPTQQPQLSNDNLADRTLIPFAVLIRACLEPAFRISLLAFGQKLAADLCQLFPGDTSNPLDAFRLLSISVLKAVVDGEGEVRDRFAVGGIFNLRIGSGSSDENDFVDTNFWHILLLLVVLGITQALPTAA